MRTIDKMAEYEYRIHEEGAVITGYHGVDEDVVIPDVLGGRPVIEIAPNVFRNAGIRSLHVPASVQTMDEWFDPEEDVLLMLYGIPFQRLMSPKWRALGLRGYIEIRMRGEELSEAIARGYEGHIRTHFDAFEDKAMESEALLRCFMKYRLIPGRAVSRLLERSNGNPELAASLLEYRGRNFEEEELAALHKSECDAFLSGPSPSELIKMWKPERLNDGSYMLTSWHGSGAVVHVPARIGRIPVTAIGIDCFSPYQHGLDRAESRDREELVRVTIPRSVDTIHAGAFRNCSGLESVVLPDTLRRLGDAAFAGCSRLRKADLSAIPEEMGKSCFLGCRNLADADGFVIRSGHLYDYYGPSDALIPEGVTHISPRAFEECVGLRKVTFPASLEAIEEFAFFRCTELSEVTIPSGVRTIGRAAFAWCTSLKAVRVEEGTKTIGENAFRYCVRLTEAVLPASLQDIGFNILVDTGNLVVSGPPASTIEKYARLYGHRFMPAGQGNTD